MRAGSWYLNNWCCVIKAETAKMLSGSSGASGGCGSILLIKATGFFDARGWTISGRSDRVHVFGHRVKASCEVVQLTSGLCANNQSVPRIMSWVPMAVT